jgi:hypothetical protein
MADTKYGKYLTKNCIREGKGGGTIMSTRHLDSFGEGHFSIDCGYIKSPHLMIPEPHRHEFAQYICFFSANPNVATDFDAEIEMSLGEEQEKQIITAPTVAYVPAGLPHGPLNFTKVNKPILFVDIAMIANYSRVGDAKK